MKELFYTYLAGSGIVIGALVASELSPGVAALSGMVLAVGATALDIAVEGF